jgi:hypothetical protein
MSRMLNPSPGEVADRQAILQLKIEYGNPKTGQTENGSTSKVQHFAEEHSRLQDYLENKWFPLLPAELTAIYSQLRSRLALINRELWERENEARTLRATNRDATSIHRAGELRFEITQLNDDRAEVVRKVNELFGINVQEKIYA